MKTDGTRGQLDLLLLAVLRASPAHGYGVIERLRERSGGTFDLPEGTVYPALHRLEREGSVASSWEAVAGRRRRVYRLTTRGTKRLEQQRSAWQDFVRAVDLVAT
jgi:DNA-binding PadR family transcriptional regulator